MEISEINKANIARHEQVRKNYELKKKAKELPVPTNDAEVRSFLTQLDQPETLPDEDVAFRRERLKE